MASLIIIPAYNEAQKIGEVVNSVKTAGFQDILIIDDGSIDRTAELAKQAGAKVLRHKLNRGQGAAIKTGIEFATTHDYDVAVFFDADGQMLASEIPNFLSKIDEDYDVVLGSRNLGLAINMPVSKKILKKIALIFSNLTTGLKLTDTHNGFQAWRIEALLKINLTQDRYAYASEILGEIRRLKLKYCEIPVTIKYTDYSNKKGQSIWNAFNILWDLLIK